MAYRKRESRKNFRKAMRDAQKTNMRNVLRKHPRGGPCL